MNLIKWIINKKKIEKEIEEQDIQYDSLLKKYGEMEHNIDKVIEMNDVLEENNTKYLETISKLRKKVNELKKEVKEFETSTH